MADCSHYKMPRYMIVRNGRGKIVLAAVVIAALLVSGCLGKDAGSVATPTPTPTPTPAAGSSPVPAPAWNTVGSPASTGQLYDMGGLNWYEFRFDSRSEIMNSSGTYRLEFGDDAYLGIPARHTRETYTDLIISSPGSPESIIDAYVSKANNSLIGGHAKILSNGQVTMDEDMAGSQIAGMMSRGYPYMSTLDRDARLTFAGEETISLNGKQYACTIYRFTVDGITRTAWYTPEAPAPLKVAWALADESRPVAVTVTLTGWG
ncbi:MAG: hypothetical protein A4E28_03087 [Methanocella sp. PtaU1.Bin125]|nr:MAG: hypothetical protein A4E28_03087 [Methanocella sp. PtaU1.Bin125]